MKIESWNVATGEYIPRVDRPNTKSEVVAAVANGLLTYDLIEGHPKVTAAWRWILPSENARVTRWILHPNATDTESLEDYYIDIGNVSVTGTTWIFTDLYLDLLVWDGKRIEIIDIDELLAANVDVGTASATMVDLISHLSRAGFKVMRWLELIQAPIDARVR